MPSLICHPVQALTPDLSRSIQLIYRTSFPADEQVPFAWLARAVEEGRSRLYICEAPGGTVLAFALTTPLALPRLHFLAYMAVWGSARSQGVGSSLFRCVLDDLERLSPGAELIWEVDADPQGAPEQRAQCQKRVAFYQKNGAHLLDAVRGYRMPSLEGAGEIPADLMWISSRAAAAPPAGARLAEIVRDLYRVIYDRGEDDPLVKSVVEGIG